MRTFITLALAVLIGTTTAATIYATSASVESSSFRPCDFWRYDSSARGYVCSFTGTRIEVASATELEALRAALAALEERVAALESEED